MQHVLLSPYFTSDMMHTNPHLFFISRGLDDSPVPEKTGKRVRVRDVRRMLLDRFLDYKMSAIPCEVVSDTAATQMAPFPVDVVITWMHHTADYAQKENYWLEKVRAGGVVVVDPVIRRHELRHVVRSLYANASWVRRIYVVVDDQQFPDWLALDSSEAVIPVYIVPHTMLYGETYRGHLPTFNVYSVECHLYKIPGLSEQFIYLRGDMFIGRPTGWQDFFTAQGAPRSMFRGGKISKADPVATAAWTHTEHLLSRVFPGEVADARHEPVPQACPLLQSSFEEALQHPRVAKQMNRTSASKFCDPGNISCLGFMVYWNKYMHLSGSGDLKTFHTQLGEHKTPETEIRALFEQGPTLFCLENDMPQLRKIQGVVVRTFLEVYFPVPCAVESDIRAEHEF